MALTDRTRKLLWGRSGNRCAKCKKELVVESTKSDEESIVGEECHIVSSKITGPRYRSDFQISQIDSYNNLILMCRTHHKMIDDQVIEYSEVNLHEVKKKHELWVKDRLEEETVEPLRLKSIKGEKTKFLFRIASGKQLFNILLGVCEASQDYPDPMGESEAELFASVFQNIQNFVDIGNDLEAGARVEASYHLSMMIGELEKAGFWLFGNRKMKVLEGGIGADSLWYTLYFSIMKCDDPGIIVVDPSPQDSASV